uniref:Odorant-binding protein 3 n=1 Tax=Yemma signatus TaxID=300820 RepID=A0A3G2GRZ4_9HEMI|nr:odorant-binding protein 3 [Yemma signatus]
MIRNISVEIVLLFVPIACIFCLTNVEALTDVMLQGFQECKEENNVTEGDLDTMKRREIPESRDAKCFLACLMERFGMMEGARLSVEGAKGMLAEIPDLPEDAKEKISQAVDDCESILQYGEGEGDPCENAVGISMCISDKAIEKGVSAPE